MPEVTPELIKELRDKTGAGMIQCRRALTEAAGDLDKAVTLLRKAGQKILDEKAGRAATQGHIGCYVHQNGAIAVLLEMSCETDFVAKTEKFRDFARNIAMQVAAMKPKWVSRQQVPPEVLEKEIDIYRAEVPPGRPPAVAEKIVQGKVEKFYGEACLLDQVYVKDEAGRATVKDLLASLAAEMKENIGIRRFVRFQVGE
ncbi:MAG: elongation factor Ts [Planctomycetes bacterium]|nr:elongation factor Ts [Planctomycetota bacterium]